MCAATINCGCVIEQDAFATVLLDHVESKLLLSGAQLHPAHTTFRLLG